MQPSRTISALIGGALALFLAAPALAASQPTQPPPRSAPAQPEGSDLGMYAALLACAFVVAQQARRSGAMKVVLS